MVGIEAGIEAGVHTVVDTVVGTEAAVAGTEAAGTEPEAGGIEWPVAAAVPLQRLGVAVEQRWRMAVAVGAEHFRL